MGIPTPFELTRAPQLPWNPAGDARSLVRHANTNDTRYKGKKHQDSGVQVQPDVKDVGGRDPVAAVTGVEGDINGLLLSPPERRGRDFDARQHWSQRRSEVPYFLVELQ